MTGGILILGVYTRPIAAFLGIHLLFPTDTIRNPALYLHAPAIRFCNPLCDCLQATNP
jgi:hypothetical protein